MEIEAGRYYRTRAGLKVFVAGANIYADKDDHNPYWLGALDAVNHIHWAFDGKVWDSEWSNEFDIISEWQNEPEKVNLNKFDLPDLQSTYTSYPDYQSRYEINQLIDAVKQLQKMIKERENAK